MEKRIIKSFSVDPAIWSQFKITATLLGQKSSNALDYVMRDYIIKNKNEAHTILQTNNESINNNLKLK